MQSIRSLKCQTVKGSKAERRLRALLANCRAEVFGDHAILHLKRNRTRVKKARQRARSYLRIA